jgi:hypothetical protein
MAELSRNLNLAMVAYFASVLGAILLGMADVVEMAAIGYVLGSGVGIGLGYWFVRDVGKV